MAFTISPNMALIIPGVGTEAGPQYATDVNNSLTIIDAHTHVAGSGVLITPAAININTDLPMNINSLTNIKALSLTPQLLTQPNNSIYDFGGNLHFVDGVGNDIPITAGGAVNATSSGISSGTATASFVGGVLVVNSAPLTPANIQAGSYLMGNNIASTKFLTLQPPNAMASNYSLTFPTIPAQLSIMTLDTSGNIGSTPLDNSTLNISGGVIQVAPAGITGTQIATDVALPGSNVSIGSRTVLTAVPFSPIYTMSVGHVTTALSGTSADGSFSWIRNGTGNATATIFFATFFSIAPIVVATCDTFGFSQQIGSTNGSLTTVITFNSSTLAAVNSSFYFIAMGAR